MSQSSVSEKANQLLMSKRPIAVGNGSSRIISPRSPSQYLSRDSALINAVRNNDEAQVRVLERTEAGLKNVNDETALIVAAIENRPNLCSILVTAEKSILNYKLQDAYMLAAKYGNVEALASLRQHFVLRTDIFNMNALDYAVISENSAAVDIILASQLVRQSDISHAILLANKYNLKALETILKAKIPASKDFPCKRCEQYLTLLSWKMAAGECGVQTTAPVEFSTPISNTGQNSGNASTNSLLAKKDAEIKLLKTMYYRPDLTQKFDAAILEKDTEIAKLKQKLEELVSQQLKESRFRDEVERYRKECIALQTQNDELRKMLDINSKDLRSSLMHDVVGTYSGHTSPAAQLLHGSSRRTPVMDSITGELRKTTSGAGANTDHPLRGVLPAQPSEIVPLEMVSQAIQVNVLKVQNYELEIAALKARLNTAEEAIRRYRANYDSLYKLSAARQNAARVLKTENEELRHKIDQFKDTMLQVATTSNRQSMDLSNLSYRGDDDNYSLEAHRRSNRPFSSPKALRCFSPNSGYVGSMQLDQILTDEQTFGQKMRAGEGAIFTASTVEAGASNNQVFSPGRPSSQSIRAIAAASASVSARNSSRQPSGAGMEHLRTSVSNIFANKPVTPVTGLPPYNVSLSRSETPYESRHSVPAFHASIANIEAQSRSSQQHPPYSVSPQRTKRSGVTPQGRESIVIPTPCVSSAGGSYMLLSPELERKSLSISSPRSLQYPVKPTIPRDVNELTPLMLAVIEADMGKFNESIKYAKQQTSSGRSALMYAVEYNRSAFIQDLIPFEAGLRDREGHTALYHAIVTGRYRIAELLRHSEGIQVPHKSRIGNRRTELMQAVIDNDIVAVWCLASMQASLQDENGATALMLAVQHMNVPAIEILYPMEYKFIDKENRTAKDYIMLIPPTATDAQREAVQISLNRNKL